PKQVFINKILNLEKSSRLGLRPERSDRELIKITKLAGRIDPISIDEYFENGGYDALKKALIMQPIDVVNEVKTSGLRGRGGAGFFTGMKWGFLHAQKTTEKVLICNADEGDPGAFMDRSMMESVPHQILEGMLIAAHATGATQIFIYCRAEYPLAIKHLKIAIKQIIEHGLNKINGRDITIKIKEGAGAFVCGEETAMIHSLEGSRGTPRFRPPYPTDSGFKGLPTMINNVETFANIPIIIKEGGEEFAKVGTANSKGTKLFALAGDLKYPGLVEVPMGITLGEVVYEIGGVEKGDIKAVQIGGPSGGCIPFDHFDVQIDYDSLKSLGAIMGSGGLIFIGNNRCMVETARYFLDFTARESCGKCTFCRVGTKRMLETLEKITAGDGHLKDIEFLQSLGQKIIKGSLCGLGQSAPNPVLTTLRYYRNEYEQHVNNKQCDALVCNALVNVYLNQDKCIECGLCIKNCPVDAISDDYVVNNEICTRCNSCIEVCPKNAIERIVGGNVSA
ncbi:4Fe-4S binding protein, partial [bacterium]|nr:4Fe-4S binding protein [bacterium]